jgi:hypothetical protein
MFLVECWILIVLKVSTYFRTRQDKEGHRPGKSRIQKFRMTPHEYPISNKEHPTSKCFQSAAESFAFLHHWIFLVEWWILIVLKVSTYFRTRQGVRILFFLGFDLQINRNLHTLSTMPGQWKHIFIR